MDAYLQQTAQAHETETKTSNTGRREFLSKLGRAALLGSAAGSIGVEPFINSKMSAAEASVVDYDSANRADASFNYRRRTAQTQRVDVGVQPDNGDATRFTDFSGSYSKALLHDALGVPNAAAWLSMKNALASGHHEDFARIGVGTPGGGGNSRLNGPQGALAFDLEGLDSHATVIPPAPRTGSAQTAAEIRQMLEGVLAPGGTASEVSVPGYTLAGKTGTAQVAVNGGYSDSRFIASFASRMAIGLFAASDVASSRAASMSSARGTTARSAPSR